MSATTFNWLDRDEYPFLSNFFPVGERKLHFIDEGKGDILLFVHGTPSWSFDYRHVIQDLRAEFRCIAIDHIGFGLSDKPSDYDYSTQNHSITLEKFVIENDLKGITLIVHDFGGPIGLNFAIKHPDRVQKLVILNSWLWSSEHEPEYIRLRRILNSPILPFLYKQLNFSPRFILPGSFGDHKLSRKLLKQYTSPFADSRQRNGALAFAKSLLHDQTWFEYLWENKATISDKPTLFIWGMKDKIITPSYLEKFTSAFKNSTTLQLDSIGHFPQEEAPEAVASGIRRFLLN